MHLQATCVILVICVDVFIIFILIYLIKHAPFLVLLNVWFAAHGARHKVLFPSRNLDSLVYTLRTCRADPERPLAITTCINHNRTRSFGHALILTALQSSPSRFRSPTNEKRRTMPTRQLIDSPADLSTIPAPATTTAAHPELLLAAQGIQRVVTKPLGRYIDVLGRCFGPDGGGYDKQRQRRRRLVARMT